MLEEVGDTGKNGFKVEKLFKTAVNSFCLQLCNCLLMGVDTWGDLGKRRLSIDRRQAETFGKINRRYKFSFLSLEDFCGLYKCVCI